MTQDPERLAERLEERVPATEAEAAAMAAKIEDRLRKTEAARTLKPSERGPTNDLREDESLLVATVSLVDGTIGIDHSTDADWHAIYKAHLSLRDRLNERLLEKDACPFKPASTEERGPTNEEIIDEALTRMKDKEPKLINEVLSIALELQADQSWFKPEPEVDEATLVTREMLAAWGERVLAVDQGEYDGHSRFQAARAVIAETLAKRPRVDVPEAVLEAAAVFSTIYGGADHGSPVAAGRILADFVNSLSQEPIS